MTARRLQWLAVLGVPVLLSLALHARFLGGEALVGWDVAAQTAPWRSGEPAWNPLALDPILIEEPRAQLFAEAGAPRWNPYTHLGEQTGSFNWPFQAYPPARLLYGLFPAWIAKGLHSILHTALAGIVMLLYLRWRGLSATSALFGGLAYELSTLHTTWLEASFFHGPIAPWAALTLWATEHAARTGRLRDAGVAGVALGGATLAAHPQNVLLLYGLTALLLTVRLRGRGLALAAGVVLVALGVGAARLLPMVIEFSDGNRSATPWATYFESTVSLGPKHVLLSVFPDLFGHPVRGFNLLASAGQRYANHQEVRLYVGLPVLLLALSAYRRGAAPRLRVGLLALVAACAYALAFASPLARIPHALFPGFGSSSPTRTLWLVHLLVPVLAAVGFERLRQGDRRATVLHAALLPLALGVCALSTQPSFVRGLLPASSSTPAAEHRVAQRLSSDLLSPFSRGFGDSPAPGLHVITTPSRTATLLSPTLGPLLLLGLGLGACALASSRRQTAARVGAALVAALAVGELLHEGLIYNPTSPPESLFPETPGVQAARDVAGADRLLLGKGLKENGLIPYGLRAVGGYGSMHSRRLATLLEAAGSPVGRQLVACYDLPPVWRDVLSVRALVVAPGATPHVPQGLRQVYSGDDCDVYANPTALPRARLYEETAVWLQNNAELQGGLLRRAGFDPGTQVLIEDPRSSWDRAASPAQPPPEPARIERDDPEHVTVVIDSPSPTRRLLVLADAYAPGWRARAGDQELKVLPADAALRAVYLPGGFKGRVEWTYSAPGASAGALLSVLALLGAFAAWIRPLGQATSHALS